MRVKTDISNVMFWDFFMKEANPFKSTIQFNQQLNSLEHHIIRIRRVSHGIGSAEQHLEGHIGNQFPHFLKALPGALVKEAHGHIERCSCKMEKTFQPVRDMMINIGQIV